MQKNYPRTLHHLPSDTAEAWLFENAQARRQAERFYQQKGQTVKLHSAYKTLLHAILETGLLDKTNSALIRYPVVAEDEPQRFRLECYPLGELLSCNIEFDAFACQLSVANPLPYYEIITEKQTHKIFVPVRWTTKSTGEKQLVSCAWLKSVDGSSQALLSDYEQIYQDACQVIDELPLTGKAPYFKTLRFDITLPMRDTPLAIGQECISLAEALHEDIYFSALEIFQHRLGLAKGARDLTPGQVIPNITHSQQTSLTVSFAPFAQHDDDFAGNPPLDTLTQPLTTKQISAHLQQLNGKNFHVTSRQGRMVQGCLLGQNDAPIKLAISGGQHANESSGVVGALRAAQTLKKQNAVVFSVCPSENPDGYAAFHALCRENPKHMHHAARYTAAGNDLAFGDSHEALIRDSAKAQLNADVHINLHGYPAHEWTRPLSGYVPSGFTFYTIPKGFFLICRYRKGHQSKATHLLNAAALAIANYPPQHQQNTLMLKRYLNAVADNNITIMHEVVPYHLEEREDTDYPIEIITEAPDETIYGEDFRIAHESQYRVILAIAEAMQSLSDSAVKPRRSGIGIYTSC